jgi:hypothetical protein
LAFAWLSPTVLGLISGPARIFLVFFGYIYWGKDDKRVKYFRLENYFAIQLEDLSLRKTIILKMFFMYWLGIYEVNLSGWG